MESQLSSKSDPRPKYALLYFRLVNFRNGKPAEIELSVGWGVAALIVALIQIALKVQSG